MKMKRNRLVLVLGPLLLAGALAGGRPPREVILCPDLAGPLSQRLSWALGEAGKRGLKESCWIGYSIRRLMGERSFIGSFSCPKPVSEMTLEEIISGKKSAFPQLSGREQVREAARAALDDLEKPAESSKQEKQVWKEVAILFKYGLGQAGGLQRVGMSNLSLAFDLEGLSFFWLGEATDEQSLAALREHYGKEKLQKAKEDLIAAAGIHGSPTLVIPFLETILKSDEPVHLRKNAVFWLSQQKDEAALRLLLAAARTDREQEVRKEAVFGISQLELASAIDALIELARNSGEAKIRREAIFWLGEQASKKAEAALRDFAYKDSSPEIQEQAVFALSQLPEEEGVTELIKIAKTHPDPRIPKKAIFWLGESHDPRALETLVEIVKEK